MVLVSPGRLRGARASHVISGVCGGRGAVARGGGGGEAVPGALLWVLLPGSRGSGVGCVCCQAPRCSR